MMNLTFQKAVDNAKALIDMGQERVYLYGDDKDRPWEHVTSASPGGSVRLDITTSIRMSAPHPCGLTFEWTFDIEPRSANGSGHHQIDVAGCKEVLAKLPDTPRAELASHLRSCAKEVRNNALQFKAAYERQEQCAIELESIF